jgi:hypothetical protein
VGATTALCSAISRAASGVARCLSCLLRNRDPPLFRSFSRTSCIGALNAFADGPCALSSSRLATPIRGPRGTIREQAIALRLLQRAMQTGRVPAAPCPPYAVTPRTRPAGQPPPSQSSPSVAHWALVDQVALLQHCLIDCLNRVLDVGDAFDCLSSILPRWSLPWAKTRAQLRRNSIRVLRAFLRSWMCSWLMASS